MQSNASNEMAALEKVGIVIVNYNGGEILEKCLATLQTQTYTSYRVIVVDNASGDGSIEAVVRAFPDVDVIKLEKNLGFAAGNNIGIAAAGDCEWIACLNPDAFPEPQWLENLLAASVRNPQYAFFGSKMEAADDPDLLDGTADIYHVSGAAWRRDYHVLKANGEKLLGEIFGPCAAAALYRRSVLIEVGGFDERYFCYFEDVDTAFRLRLRGYKCLYVPDAVVSHMGSAITGYQSNFTIYHGHRNLVWTYFKNMPLILLLIYLPQHLLLNFASLVVYSFRGKAGVIFKSKWHAFRGLPEILKERKIVQDARKVSIMELWRIMAKGLFTPYSRG